MQAPDDGATEDADAAAPRTSLREHSRKLVETTLAAHGGNISQAARQLRISRGTLYRLLRSWEQAGRQTP